MAVYENENKGEGFPTPVGNNIAVLWWFLKFWIKYQVQNSKFKNINKIQQNIKF